MLTGSIHDEGKAAELGEAYLALRPRVTSVVRAVLRGGASVDVDDAVAESFRRAIESIDRKRPSDPLCPWLLGIARHVALDRARSLSRERRRLASASEEDSSGDVMDRATNLEARDARNDDRVESMNRLRIVEERMNRLSAGTRTALTMFHLEGKSYREISEALDVPVGTVATWLLRGRAALEAVDGEAGRELLAEEGAR